MSQPESPTPVDPHTAARIHAEQVRLLYVSTLPALPAILLGVAVVAFLLWDSLARAELLGWTVWMLGVGGLRAVMWRLFEVHGELFQVRTWGRLYCVLAGAPVRAGDWRRCCSCRRSTPRCSTC